MKTGIKVWDGELHSGAHKPGEKKLCVMEAVAYVAGEAHSDHPKCACPVLGNFLRSWNDSLSDVDRKRLLAGFVFRLPGTKSTPEIEQQRGMMALEWLIKTFTPTMLDLVPALREHAKALRKLKISKENEADVLSLLKAAGAAAWDAARDAAGAAAWDAAWAAARAAAGAAARDALLPTVKKLQRSAQRLLDRMIRLTEPREKQVKTKTESIHVSNR